MTARSSLSHDADPPSPSVFGAAAYPLGTVAAPASFSILFERETDREFAHELNYFVDLNIDQIVSGAVAGRDEYELRAFINATLRRENAIRYRNEVFLDYEDTAIRKALGASAGVRTTLHLSQAEQLHERDIDFANLSTRNAIRHRRTMVPYSTAIYFIEIVIASVLSITLAISSPSTMDEIVLSFIGGIILWTLGEYLGHRFVLHNLAPIQHRAHHACPGKPVVKIFWQIWFCFVLVFWIAGGAILAGVLGAYAWYLFVHHCAHQRPDVLPKSLLRHHSYHHKFAKRNYGVSTTLWDHLFRTML
jgi:hypothetical protein